MPNTTILSSAVNQNFTDIATGLSNVLTRDGQAGMTAAFKAIAGSLGAPSITFTGDLTSGVYNPATGKVGLVGGGYGVIVNGAGFAASSAAVAAGGTGYAVGDQIVLTGGTFLLPIVLTVATLSVTAVASVTVTDGGRYTTKPTDPVAQGSTTGAGSGATFNITWTAADVISDDAGASALGPLGLSAYMQTIMGSQTASALSTAIAGTIIFPSSIGSSQNNYAPTGVGAAATIFVTSSASYNITGISSSNSANGRVLTIQNYGAFIITLTAQDASSTASNRFAFAKPVQIYPNQSVTVQWDNGASSGLAGWRTRSPNVPQIISAGFKNLLITNSGVTPNSIMLLTADALTAETALGDSVRLQSVSLSINISTSGANGLDTGAVGASTAYFIWVIFNPTTNTVAGLWSLSSTAPTLPSGYTFFVRLGWDITDGSSNLLRIRQMGRTAQYLVGTNPSVVPFILQGSTGSIGANMTLTSTSVAGFVPSTASKIHILATNIYKSGTASTLVVAPNTSYGGTNRGPGGSAGQLPPLFISDGSNFGASIWMTLEALTIGVAMTTNTSGIGCLGWEDNI